MPAYRLPSPYDRPPLRRRASGLGLALGANLLLLVILLGLGRFAPEARQPSNATIVDLLPESHSARHEAPAAKAVQPPRTQQPVPKPPPVVLPVKPTIAPPPAPPDRPAPWIEMSKAELAASDISKIPDGGSPSAGDSAIVGHGPHGETLYAAEWAREPTDAELGGYLPHNAPEGYGLIACKTMPGDRVEDCVELEQWPHGSRLAAAIRQAAWQFRVRPPRRNGRALVGEWVRIRIDYLHSGAGE